LQAGETYIPRFLPEPQVDRLGEQLAGSRLLIIAPDLNPEYRKAVADTAIGPAIRVPILELLPANGGEQDIPGVCVALWPCSMEELHRKIEEVLLSQG
jgi:hypothetical protein